MLLKLSWTCVGLGVVSGLCNLIHVLAVPAPSHNEVQPQPAARDKTLRTRELHCNNFTCVKYLEMLDNEYLAAFFIRRSLLSVAWARSCLTSCFPLKKKVIWLTFQRENEAVAHHRGMKSMEGLSLESL